MIDKIKVQQDLIAAFGFEAGMRISGAPLNNILKDFEAMLSKAPAFALVTEEYQFDDLNGSIELKGQANEITSIIIKKL